HWIESSAAQGNADALFELSMIYFTGKHLPRDRVKSRCMLGLSILHEAGTAKTEQDREKKRKKRQLLDTLNEQMSRRQKKKSRKMAVDWLNMHQVNGVDATRIDNIL
ncbi:MAG: hypothetical protein WBO57_01610, partial [Gammaproteobacteria bacterium]